VVDGSVAVMPTVFGLADVFPLAPRHTPFAPASATYGHWGGQGPAMVG
jgi:hypothetical protein